MQVHCICQYIIPRMMKQEESMAASVWVASLSIQQITMQSFSKDCVRSSHDIWSISKYGLPKIRCFCITVPQYIRQCLCLVRWCFSASPSTIHCWFHMMQFYTFCAWWCSWRALTSLMQQRLQCPWRLCCGRWFPEVFQTTFQEMAKV